MLLSLGPAVIAPDARADTPATRPVGTLVIGIYDSRAVAVAYAQAGGDAKTLTDLQRQMKDAKAAKDTKKMDQIKAEGANLQVLRHLQAFSSAPVDDILETVKDQLPAVARDAGVLAIVGHVDCQLDGAVTVDVTDQLVALFHPSDRTLKIIADLRRHEPLPMTQVLGMKD
jgi:hypothetical protein